MKSYKKWISYILITTAIYSFLSLIAIGFWLAPNTNGWLQEHIEFFYPGMFYALMFVLMFVGAYRSAGEYITKIYKKPQDKQDSDEKN